MLFWDDVIVCIVSVVSCVTMSRCAQQLIASKKIVFNVG